MQKTIRKFLFLIPVLGLLGIIFNPNLKFIITSVILGIIFSLTNKCISKSYYITIHLILAVIFIASSLFLSFKININDTFSIFIGNYIWITLSLILFILSIIIITNYLSDKFLKRTIATKNLMLEKKSIIIKSDEINLKFIDNSLRKIKVNIQTIIDEISKESNLIDNEINRVITNIKQKDEALKKMRDKYYMLQGELESLESIKQISSEHAKIIKRLIERRKYIEFVIVFIFGLLLEFIISLLTSLLR